MIILDAWQEEVLNSKGDILLCTGRRVGKTYILARKAIDRMAQEKSCPIIMISLTEDQAMIILQMALNYAREKYPKLVGRGKDKPTLRSLMINGNKMIIRPAGNTGDGARGFEGGVLIVDEAARMPQRFWIAALPIILTTNGEVWMGSTPFGKQGYFWERFNEAYNMKLAEARFKVFYISTVEAMNNRPISEGWAQEQHDGALRILKEDERTMTKLEFGQEYLGLFLEELQQFFPDELIRRCMISKREAPQENQNYALGIDIARMGKDESVFSTGKRLHEKRMRHVDMLITKKTFLNETTRTTEELNKIWDYVHIFIDDEGIGIGVFDFLIENEEIRRKLISINNSKRIIDWKEDKTEKIFKEVLYFHLKGMMERGEIELLDEEAVFQSLKSIQYEIAKEDKGSPFLKIFGSYSHICESLIRMAWETKYKDINIWIKSLKI